MEQSYTEYGEKGITIVLYSNDTNSTKVKKLAFTLRSESGSCSDKNLVRATYSIKNDTLITYTNWKRSKNSNVKPIGNRIQNYKVDENGSFYVESSKVYIERETHNNGLYKGMQYLFTPAKSEKERQLFTEYIESVEKQFNAKFVFEKEARELANEVKSALLFNQNNGWR